MPSIRRMVGALASQRRPLKTLKSERIRFKLNLHLECLIILIALQCIKLINADLNSLINSRTFYFTIYHILLP